MKSKSLKFPSYITMGAHTIKIVLTNDREFHKKQCGLWDPTTFQITIDNTLPDRTKLLTLYHELLHAALSITGHSDKLGKDEEALVLGLEHVFVPVLDQIPRLSEAAPIWPTLST